MTFRPLTVAVQWAILQGNNSIYLSNLNAIKAWTEQYFITDPAQQLVIDTLAQLQHEKVEVVVPNMEASLTALAKAVQQAANIPTVKP